MLDAERERAPVEQGRLGSRGRVRAEVLADGERRINGDGDYRDARNEWARCCRQPVVGGDERPIVIVPARVRRMAYVEGRRPSGMVAGRRARNAVVVRFARGGALVQHQRHGRDREGKHRGKHNPGSPEHCLDCIRVRVQPVFSLGRAPIYR